MTDPPGGSDQVAVATDVDKFIAERPLAGVEKHAIFMIEASGAIKSWSKSAHQLYVYSSESILSQHFTILFADDTAATDIKGPPNDILADARDDTVEVEHWHERADGSVFWGTLTLSPIRVRGEKGFAAVAQDKTYRKEYIEMLERQNDRLKEFSDILARDLQNPLRIIDQYLTLYEETGEDEHIDSIHETTDRMERLVEDLLRVARQANVVCTLQLTDIEAFITTAWHGTGETANATLTYTDVGTVSADPDRVCEMFENLFANAIVHAGSNVTVQVGPIDGGFSIEDNGPGIPEERREEVFDYGVTSTEGGSGYGLSVVRTIVNAHSWDIIATAGITGGARIEITNVEFLD